MQFEKYWAVRYQEHFTGPFGCCSEHRIYENVNNLKRVKDAMKRDAELQKAG